MEQSKIQQNDFLSSKEEIKRKYRFACLTLDMIIQISKNLHDQDYFIIKKQQ